jgi:hypothetical protein
MFGRKTKKFSLGTTEKELRSYLEGLEFGSDDQIAQILGHSALHYTQLEIHMPLVGDIVRSHAPILENSLFNYFSMTTGLVKQYRETGQRLNAAGAMVWNQSFRCLCHSELSDCGTQIWSRLLQVSDLSENYLESIRGLKETEQGDVIKGNIDQAKLIVHQPPARFE